ncbi:hypothetical protein [Stakelama marina]|uniref:Uncharacterized protein n=1 Tax=Stakelama marina TaxID=2826939 RepID=A0A8T4IGH3_9SPHN|nr:hypothetical protein [Stakelama marina]MBR0553660.1 hypothetical protein [Stakelama marina]
MLKYVLAAGAIAVAGPAMAQSTTGQDMGHHMQPQAAPTQAMPATPAVPATPATPADPENDTSAVPATPATPATAATPEDPGANATEDDSDNGTDAMDNETDPEGGA